MTDIMNWLKRRDSDEKEYHQSVEKVFLSVKPVIERNPHYDRIGILERLTEPDRVIMFRVPWMNDQGKVEVNRGFRIEMNSAIGPYKGGLRFHPAVNLSIFKLLAFEQVFKNALTTLPVGGARGGADFEPKGKSDDEIMRFCQSFMTELAHHIGPDIDIPEGGLGVGAREIGYLFGAYKKLRNEFTGVITGKGLGWGGSPIRLEAIGFGVVYFALEMLASRNESLEGKRCLVSGAGNVAQSTACKIIELGGKVLTLSDTSGHIYDEDGIDGEKLSFIQRLKNLKRGRIQEYVDKYSEAAFIEADPALDHNPVWTHDADCAFPCAMENEINVTDAENLSRYGIKLVCEGSDLATTHEAIEVFDHSEILYAPSKAASAGGVAVSCLEIAQNRMLLSWAPEEVDARLMLIMKNIHQQCLETAEQFGRPGHYLTGANIIGFMRVVNAMEDQGLI